MSIPAWLTTLDDGVAELLDETKPSWARILLFDGPNWRQVQHGSKLTGKRGPLAIFRVSVGKRGGASLFIISCDSGPGWQQVEISLSDPELTEQAWKFLTELWDKTT